MSNRHPIVRMWDVIRKDSQTAQATKNLIFTFTIPEIYQKKEAAPFIRITQILLQNTFYNDGDSANYRFLFAVETFGTSINQIYTINEHIVDVYKAMNGRCYDRTLSYDNDVGLYNEMLEFEIILPTKET